jgi:DNA repair protein RadD
MLREYQHQAIVSLRSALAQGKQSVILVAPTGSGKTRTACEIAKMAAEKGKWVLIMAPRRELILQFSEALERLRVRHGVIMAGEPSNRYSTVQVASADTLWARRNRIALPKVDLLILDEAHLWLAETRQALVSAFPDAKVVGLTATPARGDGRGLGVMFEELVMTTGVRALTDQGYLVPARYFAPSKPDLEGIKLDKDGDYQQKALGVRVDQPKLVGDIVQNWMRIAPGKSTAVFCTTRSHSRHVCEEFLRHGIRAEHLDGETDIDERKAILDRVKSGETTVLCNVFVATYGLDIPNLECAVLARPTRNITLYLQIVGRVLRICEGKTEAIVIDHSGAVEEHGFADDDIPWSLDDRESVKERKERLKQEKAEPREITCPKCSTVFKGRRDCPSCGHQLIPQGKPIPFHEADLTEIKKVNRDTDWSDKVAFMQGLRAYAQTKGWKEGWAAHAYRAKYGVYPNDPRVKYAGSGAGVVSTEVLKFVQHLNIKRAKSRGAAA